MSRKTTPTESAPGGDLQPMVMDFEIVDGVTDAHSLMYGVAEDGSQFSSALDA